MVTRADRSKQVRAALVVTRWIVAAWFIASCSAPPPAGDGGSDVSTRTDAPVDAAPCAVDLDCDDEVFCNGVEQCAPGAAGADARGCVAASPATPCLPAQMCVEGDRLCRTSCSTEPDADGDGHRAMECGGDDCDDSDVNRFPGNPEVCDTSAHDEDCDTSTFGFRDGDGDGFADGRCCNNVAGGTPNCGRDCDDNAPTVNPSSPEVCDRQDNNCDGVVDEGVLGTFYRDNDGDGFGDGAATTMMSCHPPAGYSATTGDCDDMNPAVHPGALERCDAAMLDEDCDGVANPPSLCACIDGASRACSRPGACASGTETCTNGAWGACSIIPVAETCNGVDDNCDGQVDELLTVQCYADTDNDGYAAAGATASSVCPVPGRELVGGCPPNQTNRAPVASAIDCAPANPAVNPGAFEVCDTGNVDENCNGMVNESCGCTGTVTQPCPMPGACASGTRTCSGGMWSVCSVSPVTEVCDNVDNDCDGMTDEGLRVVCYADADNDGYAAGGALALSPQCMVPGREAFGGCPVYSTSIAPTGTTTTDCNDSNPARHPNNPELCNGIDDDCSGTSENAAEGITACAAPNAHSICRSASCVTIACVDGHADCDGSRANGCEVDTYNSVTNCGGCGITCAAGAACTYGVCERVVTLAVGLHHGCALHAGGSVACWGQGTSGQLGNGATVNSTTAVVVSSLTDAVDIVVGDTHSCALRTDGTVVCWGDNTFGQLGNGAVLPAALRATPVAVSGLSGVRQISAGGSQTCALLSSGAVRCWGNNAYGQLGDNSTNHRASPVAVSGMTGATRVSVGGQHACAVNTSGTLYCWGRNSYRQLGDGTSTDRHVATLSSYTRVTNFAAGGAHTCLHGVRTGSSVGTWCSGNGANFGGPSSPSAATLISGTADDYVAGNAHTCFVTTGTNGTGSYTCSGSTTNSGSGVTRMFANVGNTTCSVAVNGTIKCWGTNDTGQTGNGNTTTPQNSPVVNAIEVVRIAEVSTGAGYGCARYVNGDVRCWGSPPSGSATDVPVHDARSLATGDATMCVVHGAGAVACWGSNTYGQLGRGTTTSSTTPADALGVADAVEVSIDSRTTCARRLSGAITCWGAGASGQLGDGTVANRSTPGASVTGIPVGSAVPVALASGSLFECALLSTGELRCWGTNASGQLGNGTTTASSTPVAVSGIDNATSLTCGRDHACAIRTDGTTWCWGDNVMGQLGDGTTSQRTSPVTSQITGALEVSAGYRFTCARLASGAVNCVGVNSSGELGNGATTNRTSYVAVTNLTNARSIASHDDRSVALTASGTVMKWGGATGATTASAIANFP